jgi:hypothetical protein
MADLASIEDKITDIEVAANAPLSEALNTRYGSNINGLIDKTDSQDSRITALESRTAVFGTLVGDPAASVVGLSASTWTDLGPTVTITSVGNAIQIYAGFKSGDSGSFRIVSGSSEFLFRYVRGASTVITSFMPSGAATAGTVDLPYAVVDNPPAGSVTYKLQAFASLGSTINVLKTQMVAVTF